MNHEDKSREELFTDPEEVVTFAQAYYATEFPNGERRGCLTAESLRRAARSDTPPDERQRAHLFGCSECFRTFRSARMNRRAQAPTAGRWRERVDAMLAGLRSPWAPVAAGLFGLIILGLVAVPFLRHRRTEAPAVALERSPQESPTATSPEATGTASVSSVTEADAGRARPDRSTAKVSPREAGATERRTRRTPSLRIVYIDLVADDLSRGDDQSGAGRRVITLAPERQRLRLRMPRGSVAGRYTVRVVDAFGKSLLSTEARFGGRILTVNLDLRGLTAKSYRLCLSRDGEAPDCYLMYVTDKQPAP